MATKLDLEVVEDDDPLFTFTCKQNGVAQDLTGATVHFYIKPSVEAEEGAAGVIDYQSGGVSPAVTILNPQTGATLGKLTVQVSAADIATPLTKKWRLQVTKASKKITYGYGRFRVKNV